MLKARLLMLVAMMVAIAALFSGWCLFINSEKNNSILEGLLGCVLLFPSPFIFVSSLIMLLFSLFRVQKSATGQLVYNPSNPYWWLLSKIFPSLKQGASLCTICWATAFVVFCSSFLTFSLLLFYFLFKSLGLVGSLLLIGKIVGVVLASAIFLGLSVGLISLLSKLPDWPKKIVLAVFLVSIFFVLIPFGMRGEEDNIWSVLLKCSALYGGIILAILFVLGPVVFFQEILPRLSDDNLLKQWILAGKKNLCPRIGPAVAEEVR